MDVSSGLHSPQYTAPVYREVSYGNGSNIVREGTGIVHFSDVPLAEQVPVPIVNIEQLQERIEQYQQRVQKLGSNIEYLADRASRYQRLAEETIVRDLVVCDATGRYDNLALLSPLQAMQVKTELNGNFYSTELLKWLACSFEGTFKYKAHTGEIRTRDEAITNTISELIRIGTSSADGYVWSAKFKTVDGFFLFKTGKTKDNDNETFHEYFVAVTCLNTLRYAMSNFMYVYGAFQCTTPKVVKDGQPHGVNYCSPNPLTGQHHGTYVIIENIPGAISWSVAMSEATLGETVSWLMQLTDALAVAHTSYGYTHYDLHYNNVLLRPMGRAIYVRLPRDGRWIKTRHIPTIIDYGRNRVVVNGEPFGYYYNPSSARPDVSRPEHDLYKLLGFTMYASAGLNPTIPANRNLLKQLLPVFRFFPHVRNITIDNVDGFLRADEIGRFDIGSRLELTDEEKSTFYKRFQDYLMELFGANLYRGQIIINDISQLPNGAMTWNCHHNMCL